MGRRLIIVCAAFVLALITVSVAPSFLHAQGQPQQSGQQVQGQQGQGQGQGQQPGARGQQGGRGGGRGQQPAVPSKPTPRWPDGHPRLGALPDEKAIWGACCGGLSNADTPFQPW